MIWGSWTSSGGSFIATDTRVTHFDGSVSDCGGKVFSTGSGFATGAGLYPPLEDAMSGFKAAGAIPNHPAFDPSNPRYRQTVANRAKQISFGALTVGTPQHWSTNALLVVEPHTPVILLNYRTGEVQQCDRVGDGPSDLATVWPSIGKEMMQSDVDAGDDLAARIRVAASYFESCAIRSYVMSSTMEIGFFTPDLRRGFLRGRARDIANARVDELLQRFDAKPLEVDPMQAASRASRGARWYLRGDGPVDTSNYEWPSVGLGAVT